MSKGMYQTSTYVGQTDPLLQVAGLPILERPDNDDFENFKIYISPDGAELRFGERKSATGKSIVVCELSAIGWAMFPRLPASATSGHCGKQLTTRPIAKNTLKVALYIVWTSRGYLIFYPNRSSFPLCQKKKKKKTENGRATR